MRGTKSWLVWEGGERFLGQSQRKQFMKTTVPKAFAILWQLKGQYSRKLLRQFCSKELLRNFFNLYFIYLTYIIHISTSFTLPTSSTPSSLHHQHLYLSHLHHRHHLQKLFHQPHLHNIHHLQHILYVNMLSTSSPTATSPTSSTPSFLHQHHKSKGVKVCCLNVCLCVKASVCQSFFV